MTNCLDRLALFQRALPSRTDWHQATTELRASFQSLSLEVLGTVVTSGGGLLVLSFHVALTKSTSYLKCAAAIAATSSDECVSQSGPPFQTVPGFIRPFLSSTA